MTEQVRRASRLVEIERLLRRNPQGLTTLQIARLTGYSQRTVQRDIAVLESELGVPLEVEGRRWRLMPGSAPIGAVRFTLHEARAVYLATRLFLRHADERDPDGIAALRKLADAFPPALGAHVEAAAGELGSRPLNETHARVLRVLTEGWAGTQRVRIRYRSQASHTEKETVIDPYLLEPSATGAATYVVGFSHKHGQVRTFKIDRIFEAVLTGEPFEARGVEELRTQMGRSWGGVILGEDEVDVVLEFAASVAERVRETHWHASERLADLPGGRLRFEVRLPSLLEFIPWVRSWGPAVRVVAPEALREEIATSLRAAAEQYG
jgi:predicted DNA-binding transcriptional regulator YafY